MSHLNNSTTSMELSQPMDVSSDEERTRNKIFLLICPFCNDEFVIPIVFISHPQITKDGNQITVRNVTEKNDTISVLGKRDDASGNFWLPY